MRAELTEYISGLKFPAEKRDILVLARIKNAPSSVMNELLKIGNHRYINMTELWHEINQFIFE